jgi:hypothetical protein
MKSPSPRSLFPWLVLALLAASAGCNPIRPRGVVTPSTITRAEVSHADYGLVLERFVNDEGRVDYRGLMRDPGLLERYYLWLATISPHSDPAHFATRNDALAYWINAYNASALVTVVRYYPITSVSDVRTPFPLWLASDKAGFFLLQRIELGDETTSLYTLESSIIRGKFDEPRVHFALNCASIGCPRLPREPFVGDRLDAQLDREARRFFAEERNLAIDHAGRTVTLSSILDWYEDDFTGWYERAHPGEEGTLLAYAALYAPPEKAADLARARDESYAVRFAPYDWGLNGQAGS